MEVERSRPRISPKDFRDFSVSVQVSDETITGYLGNISETGLCLVCPEGTNIPEESSVIHGHVESSRLESPIDFKGRVAWKSVTSMKKSNFIIIVLVLIAKTESSICFIIQESEMNKWSSYSDKIRYCVFYINCMPSKR